jgi:hypothetical protein
MEAEREPAMCASLYQILEHGIENGIRAFACAMCGALVNERGETLRLDERNEQGAEVA